MAAPSSLADGGQSSAPALDRASRSPSTTSADLYQCQWLKPERCSELFSDAELLYEHITNAHIGRKTTNNLSLECAWEGCTAHPFNKRDHVTSHIRIHVPFKPHVCEICGRAFKRPQDKKKHDKLHQDEADAADGNDNSTLRVPRPIAQTRRRSSAAKSTATVKSERSASFSSAASGFTQPDGRSPVHATTPLPDYLVPGAQGDFSPYSSDPSYSDVGSGWATEESPDASQNQQFFSDISPPPATAPVDRFLFSNSQNPLNPGESFVSEGTDASFDRSFFDIDPAFTSGAIDGLFASDFSPPLNPSTGLELDPTGVNDSYPRTNKRGYDLVDDFMMDYKKKKSNNPNDPVLAQKLDEIAALLFEEPTGQPQFNSLDAHPVEDLDELNQFLLQLSSEIDDSSYYPGLGVADGFDPAAGLDLDGIANGGAGYLPNGSLGGDVSSTMAAYNPQLYATDDLSKLQMAASTYQQPPTTPPENFGPGPVPTYPINDFQPITNSNINSFARPTPTANGFTQPQSGIQQPFMATQFTPAPTGNFTFTAPQPTPAPTMRAGNVVPRQQPVSRSLSSTAMPAAPTPTVLPQEQQQQTYPYYPPEMEHFGALHLPVLLTIPLQQAAPEPAQPTPTATATATATGTPTPTATPRAAPPQPTRTTRTPSTTKPADGTDALLKQFRMMHIESEISKQPPKQPANGSVKVGPAPREKREGAKTEKGQVTIDLKSKRTRHSMLVKALLHKVGEKLRSKGR